MAAHGFHPANPDIFGQQNSHSREWGDFIDGTHTPNTHVAMWMGDWRAANGDCITTALRDVTPVGTETDSTAVLEVTSLYMNIASADVPACATIQGDVSAEGAAALRAAIR